MSTSCLERLTMSSDSPMSCCAGMNGLSYSDASGVCIECGETGMYELRMHYEVWALLFYAWCT